MNDKEKIFEEFYRLADFYYQQNLIKDAQNYKKDFSAFLLYLHHIKTYELLAPFCRDKTILDIGCFLGYGEPYIAEEAKEVIAIDNNRGAINFARNHYSLPNVDFRVVDAKQLPFEDESIDIVLAVQLIEHIQPGEIEDFLKKIKKLLRKDGQLLLVTPNREFRLLPFQKPFNPEHFQEFTKKTLHKSLEKIFDKIEIKGIYAAKWIEEIERKRVRRSPLHFYINDPLIRLLRYIVQKTGISQKNNAFFQRKQNDKETAYPCLEWDFDGLLEKLSDKDFFIKNEASKTALDLFSLCAKD
ncbi:MAG: methyltransferase domain-containing protein [Candidatus Omnitrophota bacterium]